MTFAFRFSSGGNIGSTELVMNMWFVRRQLGRHLQIAESVRDRTLLQKRFAQLVIGVGEIRLCLNNFAHQFDARSSLLLGKQHKTKMILGLQVARIQGQFIFKFFYRFIEVSGLYINQARIIMNQRCFRIERLGQLQFFKSFRRFPLFVISLREQDMKL